MEEVWNLVGVDEDPLHHVSDGIEDKRSWAKAKGKNQVHIELVTPLHPQKNTMGRVNGHVAVSCLHIKFGHEGPHTKIRDYTDHLIEFNVMKSKFVWINPIVDTGPPRGGKVHDEAPLPRLASFRNNPKAANVKIREGRNTERTCHPTQRHLIGQILVNHRRMLSCRWLVFFGRLELLGGRKPQVKPMAESLQHKVDLLSVGMKSQLPRKLLCQQRGDCWNWGESD